MRLSLVCISSEMIAFQHVSFNLRLQSTLQLLNRYSEMKHNKSFILLMGTETVISLGLLVEYQ